MPLTSAEIWAIEGVTIMNGLDDDKAKTEVTTLADAQKILDFATANGMAGLSMWAIQRDNGGCKGVVSGSCSGIVQDTWDFTQLLRTFTAP